MLTTEKQLYIRIWVRCGKKTVECYLHREGKDMKLFQLLAFKPRRAQMSAFQVLAPEKQYDDGHPTSSSPVGASAA